jgi:hypothetical protein
MYIVTAIGHIDGVYAINPNVLLTYKFIINKVFIH